MNMGAHPVGTEENGGGATSQNVMARMHLSSIYTVSILTITIQFLFYLYTCVIVLRRMHHVTQNIYIYTYLYIYIYTYVCVHKFRETEEEADRLNDSLYIYIFTHRLTEYLGFPPV